MAVQWLGLHASTAGGTGLIPGQGTKIPHALWHGQKQNKTEKERGQLRLERASLPKQILNQTVKYKGVTPSPLA